MGPLRRAWTDYRDAVRAFSRPARVYLLTEFLAWTAHGVYQVLFNLYLVRAGHGPAVVGHAISLVGIGLAVAAIPAGVLANRWGRRRCILLGATLDGLGNVLRVIAPQLPVIYGASLIAGVGQAFLQISGYPFLTEHSTPRERTHLFSAFFAVALLAGVVGNALGGWLPGMLSGGAGGFALDLTRAYQVALVLGGAIALLGTIPMLRLRVLDARLDGGSRRIEGPVRARLVPIGVNALLIGAGAGLVIPFMNLYFAQRFQCSSAQIGSFFSIAQVCTAAASLLGPALARRYGKLRTAVGAELMSLPFLVTLGAEHSLSLAVGAFWIRATLMQAASPLLGTFVMEALPPAYRAHATSLTNLAWNIGWSISATLAGVVIQHFGYSVPFYITAVLYGAAALYFYFSFRNTPETADEPRLSEEAKGLRGEGPVTE